MSAIITAVLSLLGGFTQPLKDWFAYKQEAAKKEYDFKLAALDSQTKQIISSNENETARSTAVLNATGTYFKYFTFFMWFGPFMLGTVWPSKSKEIFENLAGMPDWYVQSCMVIMFTVWGISVSAPVVANVFSNLSNFLANRKDSKREFELAKEKINRDAVAKELRLTMFQQGMTQDQVNLMDKIVDIVDKQ